MSKVTKLTGTQVKELLTKAVGGIYVNRGFGEILTDYFKKFEITDDGLKLNTDDFITLTIPIDESEQHINYAISGEDIEADEEWEGSTYFDYKLCIAGYTICFSVENKGKVLTWEQFKELTDFGNYGVFEVRSMDTCSVYLDIDHCTLAVNDREIEINSNNVNSIIDRDIIDAIYNDSEDANEVSYRLEFNNGMSDMNIEVEYRHRLIR